VYRPKAGYPNASIELPVFTHLPLSGERGKDSMSRNHLNVLTAQALVVLPGDAGTLSEAELALRYRKPALLFGPLRALHRFPEQLERTDSLERVCEWLLETVR
jgi:hypothetical protein